MLSSERANFLSSLFNLRKKLNLHKEDIKTSIIHQFFCSIWLWKINIKREDKNYIYLHSQLCGNKFKYFHHCETNLFVFTELKLKLKKRGK